MSKETLKLQIDTDILNKTLANSISPLNVAKNLKDVIDLIPDDFSTKVTAGINTSITGLGTTISPYIINNTITDTRPYKVYTAILNQLSTNNPIATVLENTLGGTITWTRYLDGRYRGTLSIAGFTTNKTIGFATPGNNVGVLSSNLTIKVSPGSNASEVIIFTVQNGTLVDDLLSLTPIEIRVYN